MTSASTHEEARTLDHPIFFALHLLDPLHLSVVHLARPLRGFLSIESTIRSVALKMPMPIPAVRPRAATSIISLPRFVVGSAINSSL